MARYLKLDWTRVTAETVTDDRYVSQAVTLQELAGLNTPLEGGEAPITLLYIYDSRWSKEQAKRVEDALFNDDDVAVMGKLVRFARLDGATLHPSMREKFAPALPTVHIMDGMGEPVAALVRPRSSKHVEAGLARAFRVQYRMSLRSWMKRMEKSLRAIEEVEDKIYAANEALKTQRKRAEKRMTASKKRSIQKAETEVKELQAEMAKREKIRDKILKPPLSRKFVKRVKAAAAAEVEEER